MTCSESQIDLIAAAATTAVRQLFSAVASNPTISRNRTARIAAGPHSIDTVAVLVVVVVLVVLVLVDKDGGAEEDDDDSEGDSQTSAPLPPRP